MLKNAELDIVCLSEYTRDKMWWGNFEPFKKIKVSKGYFVKLIGNHHIFSQRENGYPVIIRPTVFRNSLIILALDKLVRNLLQGVEFTKCLLHPASQAAVMQLPPQWFALILWNERTGGSAQV